MAWSWAWSDEAEEFSAIGYAYREGVMVADELRDGVGDIGPNHWVQIGSALYPIIRGVSGPGDDNVIAATRGS